MILAAFCIGSAVLGALLQVYFRRFSWSYLLVSIILSAAAFESVRLARRVIGPDVPLFQFLLPLMMYYLVPWFLFAFLPLQIGYFGAKFLRFRFFSV